MGWYRAPNKRMIARGGNGRFRPTTLGDLGLGGCKECGKIFTPDYELAKDPGSRFIDPFRLAKVKSTCPECLTAE